MRLYAQVSGAFFGFLALAQLTRTVLQVPIHVADIAIPVWTSACAFVVLSALAIWAFRSTKRTA